MRKSTRPLLNRWNDIILHAADRVEYRKAVRWRKLMRRTTRSLDRKPNSLIESRFTTGSMSHVHMHSRLYKRIVPVASRNIFILRCNGRLFGHKLNESCRVFQVW
jgi:hypothetical protein